MRAQPHLAIIYEDPLPVLVFDDFQRMVAAEGLDLAIESRPKSGPFAGIEWMLPTAAMLFITQSYFNGFLGEMGKDHYQALKNGIRGLCARFRKVKITIIGTPGKASPTQPYSLVFSIWFAAEGDRTFKFLIPIDKSDAEIDEALNAFFDFLEAYSSGSLPHAQADRLAETRPFGRIVLLAFNPQTQSIDVMNPMTRKFENEASGCDEAATARQCGSIAE